MKANLKSLIIFILSVSVGVFLLDLPALLTTGIKPYNVIPGEGVLSVTHLDDAVVGWGANWKTYAKPGMSIIIDGVEYKIKTIENYSTITLTVPYMGETSKRKSYSSVYPRDLPFVDEAMSQMDFLGIPILLLIGVVFGYFHPKRSWRWGLGTIAPFYIFAIAEMSINPYSHNLFPFEFLMYGFMVIPGILAARFGEFLRVKFSPKT